MTPSSSAIIRITSIVIFLIALALPCFNTANEAGEVWEGLSLLISGCFGFYVCLTGLTWLANPALFCAWFYLRKKPETALTASSIASLLALSFILCTNMINDESGDTYSPITGYRIGYWLWLASALIMLAGSLYLSKNEKNEKIKSLALEENIIENPGKKL
jgi:peptidoglycan biosynthesis protein MviN/MurJ (putative lipid II flippase)